MTYLVLRDTLLFNSDVKYNIRFGRVTASDQELEEAAVAADIHARILTFHKPVRLVQFVVCPAEHSGIRWFDSRVRQTLFLFVVFFFYIELGCGYKMVWL